MLDQSDIPKTKIKKIIQNTKIQPLVSNGWLYTFTVRPRVFNVGYRFNLREFIILNKKKLERQLRSIAPTYYAFTPELTQRGFPHFHLFIHGVPPDRVNRLHRMRFSWEKTNGHVDIQPWDHRIATIYLRKDNHNMANLLGCNPRDVIVAEHRQ